MIVAAVDSGQRGVDGRHANHAETPWAGPGQVSQPVTTPGPVAFTMRETHFGDFGIGPVSVDRRKLRLSTRVSPTRKQTFAEQRYEL